MLNKKAMMATAAGDVPWGISNFKFTGTPVNFFAPKVNVGSLSGIFFKPDGTKMYVLDSTDDEVVEYNLSSIWDVSTASYVQNFSVATEDTTPQGLFFHPDGTKFYTVGFTDDEVHEYSISSAWDISTASYVRSFSIAAEETAPQSIFFKPDGTRFYICGTAGDDVNEYSLSTAWNISTASYTRTFSVASQTTSPQAVFFKPDGTKMYIAGTSSVFEYSLSTAWNISTASFAQSFAEGISPQALFFKSDGSVFYYCGALIIKKYDLSLDWDISTASFTEPTTDFLDVSAQELSPQGVFFKPDGTKLYICGTTGDDVNEYNLSSAWDISTASFLQSFSVATQELDPQSIFFKPDGTKFYICGTSGDDVNEYSLSSAWDISTATYVQNFSVSSQDGEPQAVFFKPDGTKMYIVGNINDSAYEYNLSSAWDISTASYVQSFSLASQDVATVGLFFKPDGKKMYVVGGSNGNVYEYDLSSAWDISTASYVQSVLVFLYGTTQNMFFKDDGKTFYVVNAPTLLGFNL